MSLMQIEDMQNLLREVDELSLALEVVRRERALWREEAVASKQALRQIIMAIQTTLTDQERLDSVLRIARQAAGP